MTSQPACEPKGKRDPVGDGKGPPRGDGATRVADTVRSGAPPELSGHASAATVSDPLLEVQ